MLWVPRTGTVASSASNLIRHTDARCQRRRRVLVASPPRSAFAGFRFPPDVIVLAVAWYQRFLGSNFASVASTSQSVGV
jgi:hypothetical protein